MIFILGDNKTGKTALIYIVDYCLGSSECDIPEKTIREFAQWYAIVIQTEDEQILVARKNLSKGTSQIMCLLVQKFIPIPETTTDLRVKTNRDAVVKELSQRLGMMERSLAESSFDKAYTESPTIRNVASFLFQPSHIIANKDMLFYKMNKEQYQQRLRRILPWLLGSLDQEYLNLKEQLEEAQRRLRQLERQNEEQERLRRDTMTHASSLWRQAQMLGLVEQETGNVTSKHSPRKALEQILKKHVNDIRPESSLALVDPQRTAMLIRKSEELRREIARDRHQLAEAEALATETAHLNQALDYQTGRLQIVDILPQEISDVVICPLCNQQVGTFAPLIERLYHVRDDLREQLTTMKRVRPRLDSHIRELHKKVETYQEELKHVEIDLQEFYRVQQNASSTRDVWTEQQRLLGAIRFYLEQNPSPDVDFSTVKRDLLDAQQSYSAIKERLEQLEAEDHFALARYEISQVMTNLGKLFPLEEQDATLYLDTKRLTVRRQFHGERSTWLPNIGSDENAVGYHLCALLALHTFFIRHRCPVPSFLFLDQLSQPYFSSERAQDTLTQPGISEDTYLQFFTGITNVVEGLDNQLQVIVLDHASLPQEFRPFFRKEWRGGKKLI